jgi:protein arginine N-methyltransferase 1
MYSLRQFGAMINDRVRMDAFSAAITAAIRPGDVVFDVGAGTGIFSFLACLRGARHVYAVDTNPHVREGIECARRNGFDNRITFIRGDALSVRLDEKVDVILGDIRGRLPGFDLAVDLYRDLSAKHLRPGGRVIPQRDTILVAPISADEIYDNEVRRPWADNPYGLDLTASLPSIVNSAVPYSLPRGTEMLGPKPWVTLDYAGGVRIEPEKWLAFPACGRTNVHFLALWFDTVLFDDIGYTNAPNAAVRPLVYNQMLLPLAEPVALDAGDVLEVALRADPAAGDFLFTYAIRVGRAGVEGYVLERRQSTFDSLPIHDLRRRSASYVPRLGERARLLEAAIGLMDGDRALREISDLLQRQFPELLPKPGQALEFVADLSQVYGE